MYEIDILKSGEQKDADAIAARFTRPDNAQLAHGWQDDGDTVVEMVRNRYGTDHVDLAIVMHPDGDHIGGMGTVLRQLDVDQLLVHRIDQRGGGGLPAAAAVLDLVNVAEENGTDVVEPFVGLQAFGGAVTILGPDDDYYDGLVQEQRERGAAKSASVAAALMKAARTAKDRFLEALPVEEFPFDDGEGCGPRNNSSVITLVRLDARGALLTADAGVDALQRALDYAQSVGLDAAHPDLVQMPHHGSRRNASSESLDRVLGPIGRDHIGAAFVSVVGETDRSHPAGHLVNAYARRGYQSFWTAGNSIRWNSPDAPPRYDYHPLNPLPPMDESDDD
jgi:hypothetical protein